MIENNNSGVTINALSNEDKKKLKDALRELDDSMTRVAAERDLQKEIINKIFEDIGVEKKLTRRMAKVHHKANYGEEVEGNRNFEEFYDAVVKNTLP